MVRLREIPAAHLSLPAQCLSCRVDGVVARSADDLTTAAAAAKIKQLEELFKNVTLIAVIKVWTALSRSMR